MANRKHGLDEKEMELVKLLMADCKSTGDIQEKLKRLFAGTIEQMLKLRWTSILVMRKIRLQATIPETAETATARKP